MRKSRDLAATERVLKVLQCIVDQPREWTAKRLADHLGVSERTIRRVLRALDRVGFLLWKRNQAAAISSCSTPAGSR